MVVKGVMKQNFHHLTPPKLKLPLKISSRSWKNQLPCETSLRSKVPPLLRQRRTWDVFFLVLVGHIWINVLRHSLMEDSWYASWGTGSLSHYLQTSRLCFGLVRPTAPPLLRQRRTWDVFFLFSLDIFESMCSGTCWWKMVGAPVEVQVVYPTIYKLQGFVLDWSGQRRLHS